MNLKQLKYVLVLANSGSFSKAAGILNISQPSLSQYVKKIEEQVCIELFERAGGSVRITDAGRIYIEIGRKILDLENQMQNRFMDISQHKSGTLIIGTSPFRSASFMPTVAAAFRKKYPGIQLVISEMETQDLIESAERGAFDLCVTNLPVDDKIYSCEEIMEEEIVVAVQKDSELDVKLRKNTVRTSENRMSVIDMQLLNNEFFVMLTDNQFMQKILGNICSDYGLSLQTAVIVKSIEAQIEMVSKGLGAACVPEGVQKLTENDGKISYYSVMQELPKRKLAVIYPKEKYLSVPLQDMIEIIKSVGCR